MIAFQEVRQGAVEGNQLMDLAKLLPNHKWIAYETATHMTDDGKQEGIGIASRFPIVETRLDFLCLC